MKRIIVLVLALFTNSASALPVVIDPNTFGGEYCIDRLSECFRGTQTVELQQGRHTILFAPGNGFSFEIDSDGIVNVEAPFDHAAEGSDGTLTFLTSSIGINFGDYQGRIEILGATEVLEPTTTTIFVEVLNGIENWVFQLAPGTAFRFDTDEFGAPIIDPVYASVSNRVLSLNTTTIVIDPSSYTGNYGVTNVTEDSDRPRRVELIPGVDQYILNFAPGTGLRFDIDEQGNVTSSSRGAEGDGAALRLMPRTLPVEPINPNVGWFIIGAEANTPIAGSRMVTLVPDVAGWALSVGPGTVGRFALDEQSIPVPPVVTVFQGTLVHEFILGATRDEVTCQFSGEIDLRQDLNGGVPNQESGPEILLSGDMLVGLTPISQGSNFAWYSWSGSVTLSDQTGQIVAASSGAFLISDDGTQRMISFYARELAGTLGGEQPSANGNVALAFSGPATPPSSTEFPADIHSWNDLRSRIFVFRAFQSGAIADVSHLTFRGTGCF